MALSYSERIALLKNREQEALNSKPAKDKGAPLQFEVESISKIRLAGEKLMPHVPAVITVYESEVDAFRAAYVEDESKLEAAYESYMADVEEYAKLSHLTHDKAEKTIAASEAGTFRKIYKRDPKPLRVFRQLKAASSETFAASEPVAAKKK